MFEMATTIQTPARCEVRSVIRFLNAKGERPVEIHKQIVVYGNAMNRQNLHLKKHLAGKKFDENDEVQEEVMMWFNGRMADSYDSGIQKLVPRFNKCLDNAGNYVGK